MVFTMGIDVAFGGVMTRKDHTMPSIRHRIFTLAAVAVAGVALVAPVAGADPGATVSGSAAGISVPCIIHGVPVTFTASDGTFHEVNQMHQDSTGVYHFTGTFSLQGVSATDGTTNTPYSIVGASWYGGSGTSPQTATVRATDEFNIIGPSGRVADVHASMTFYPDGTTRGVVFGDCTPFM